VSGNVLYVNNDFGVYVTTNGEQRWEVRGGNLPSVKSWSSSSIHAIACSSAVTHGRGVWVIDGSGIK
jgi:hypothetical protein